MSLTSERAETIARFLRDEVVQDVLADLRQDAYRLFLAATNDDARRDAHSSAKALDRLETAFQAIVDAGERERLDEENAERLLATR